MSRWLTGTALALFFQCSPAFAETPNVIYVLGDSSADLGSFGANLRPTNAGQMWSERLAARIGLKISNARTITVDDLGNVLAVTKAGGTSYALNGATALRFDGTFTLGDEVDFLLQDRKTIGARDLTLIWISRNDITSALLEGSAFDAKAFATAYSAQVDRLRQAGARNIVAFGSETDLLPRQLTLDAGFPADVFGVIKAQTLASEAALWPELAKRGVYILDLNKLAEDVRLNLKKYGFTAGVDSYQGRGDLSGTPSQARPNDGNVFTNDGHYTTQMQAVVADYTLAQLRARDQIVSALYGANLSMRAVHDRIDDAASALLDREGRDDGWRLGASAAGLSRALDTTTRTGADLDGDSWAVEIGAHRRAGPWAFGLRGGVQRDTLDFAEASGRIERTDYTISGFAARRLGGGFSLDASTTIGSIDLSAFDRRAKLGDTAKVGTHGATQGSYSALGFGLRHAADKGACRFGAGVGLSFDRTQLNAFSERADTLALSYGDQVISSALAHMSFNVERVGDERTLVRPFASFRLATDLGDGDLKVRVGPTKATIVDYTPERQYRAGTQAQLGVKLRVAPSTDLTLAATETTWSNVSKRATDAGVRVSIARAY